MTNEPSAASLKPSEVLAQVADALPEQLRGNVIIVGSMAAAYNFFSGDGSASLRTKDVDVLFSPHAVAVDAAVQVTERMLAANWTQREDVKFGKGGRPEDKLDDLPVVRLQPPPTGEDAPAQWFLELLSAPPEYVPGGEPKTNQRVHTCAGDFTIPSFAYLALAEWRPITTRRALLIARPEMMALANMLHHPVIGEALINGTAWKRSNKDLGRVLALAYLTLERDRRAGTDEFDHWADCMWDALREKFGSDARNLAMGAGAGIDALLASRDNLAQALRIANLGLLASLDVDMEAITATGRRFQAVVLEHLVKLAGD